MLKVNENKSKIIKLKENFSFNGINWIFYSKGWPFSYYLGFYGHGWKLGKWKKYLCFTSLEIGDFQLNQIIFTWKFNNNQTEPASKVIQISRPNNKGK